MAMRATWKGEIEVGKHPLPVKLYAAVQDTQVHFHLLHAADGVRVEQRIVNPKTGKPVEKNEIQKGFALGSGTYVVLEAKELKALQPEPSRSIEVLRFVPDAAIAPAWFERPYLLGPDGDSSAYLAFTRALADAGRQAIVHWVMRGRSYTGALRSNGARLLLVSLRDREEVVAAPALDVPNARAPSEKELALAEQLVAALESEFDPSQFHSDYQERVRKLVEQKAKGKHVRLVKPEPRKPSAGSLEAALRASVSKTHNRERKSA
jgi:DNA end-binding protein Ku